MFNIGNNILYGISGIMTIVDIRQERLTDEEKTYYVLSEYGGKSTSLTYVPLDNEKLISSMHPLLTRDEVTEAISGANGISDIPWNPDSRARAEGYRAVMRSADRAAILVMIRTIYNTGLRRAEIGKKNFQTDENIMNKAEAIMALELSIVLGITPAEAQTMIDREVKGVTA
jgi:RNA polymerase-interacting CarD/CdnL/TRCF family regulator